MPGPCQAFGRGFIKLLVSFLAGSGVGLLVTGNAVYHDPEFFRSQEPPPGLFLALGAGLLTSAGMLMLLFFVPWWWRKSAPLQDRKV